MFKQDMLSVQRYSKSVPYKLSYVCVRARQMQGKSYVSQPIQAEKCVKCVRDFFEILHKCSASLKLWMECEIKCCGTYDFIHCHSLQLVVVYAQ